MGNLIDLTGQYFGELKVIKYAGNRQWECKCSCGSVIIKYGAVLRNNKITHCGCKRIPQYMKLPKGESGINRVFGAYKKSARKRNKEWIITKIQFKELVSKRCYYCGRSPSQKASKHFPWATKDHKNWIEFLYNGLDRFDNKKGYTFNNVVPCCTICNFAKNIKSQKEFYKWIKDIVCFNKHLIKED